MSGLQVINQQEVLGRDFKIYGDFENPLFLAKDVAEWIGYAKTGEGYYDVSAMLRTVDCSEKTTINNRSYLTEDGLYEVLMQSRKPIAKQFKAEVKKILKDIRKHGMYAVDELLDNPDLLIAMATQLKEEREAKRKLEIENAKKQREIDHKEDVIIGLVDKVELAQKRAILNRVVRYNRSNYQERWALLYREFENKYHINLSCRVDEYNRRHKPKIRKLEYIEKVMEKLPDLYEIACKLFETDIKALCKEMYGIVG